VRDKHMMSKTKRRQPKFAIASIILTVAAFVIFVAASFIDPISEYSSYLMIVGLALLIASWGIYFFAGKPQKEAAEAPETVMTVIGCKGCDIREERAFATGDYIFKDLGPCKKCSGSSFIKAIYAVTPPKKE